MDEGPGVDKKDMIHTLRFLRIDAWLTQLEYLAQNVTDRTRFDPAFYPGRGRILSVL